MTQGYQLKSMAAAVGLSWSCKTISHTNGGAGLCTVVCWLGKHFYEPPQPDQIKSIQSYDMGKYLPHSLIHWKWSEKIIFKLYSSSCQSGWFAYLINVEECALERWTLQSYLAPTPKVSVQELNLGMKREISGCLPIDGTSKVLNYEFLEKMSCSPENWAEPGNWLNFLWYRVAATKNQQQQLYKNLPVPDCK